MSQSSNNRADNKYTTSIKPLGNNKYGARVYKDGTVIMEDNSATNKKDAARALKECLRMVDKCGYDCPMASKSRNRFACGKKPY